MAENSNIEWCDHTFNPWTGCTKVSEGCAHCYAESWAKRSGIVQWGPGKQRRRTTAENWKEPLKWDRAAKLYAEAATDEHTEGKANGFSYPPTRPRVFCASLADWLDDEVPIEWLADLMELIVRTPNLDWLLLTKRPQNWERRITDALAEVEGIKSDWPSREPYSLTGHWLNEWLGGNAPANVWIGTTVENQARADERLPQLLSIPATVRFLSCEPLLGDLNFWPPVPGQEGAMTSDWSPKGLIGIHWVIAGGESGPGARPMHPDWARSLRDQCSAAGVPFFFKQWGEWVPSTYVPDQVNLTNETKAVFAWPWAKGRNGDLRGDTTMMVRVGKTAGGRLLSHREWDEFPGGEE